MRVVRTIPLLCVALAASLVLGPSLGVRASEALPSGLSDAEFWTMIDGFSEPDGKFLYDNFLSNETSIQTVIPTLIARTSRGGAYLGVGPEQNFTYIAALQPKIAFVIDIRRQNLVEHLMYKALFDLSGDRADFVSRLFSRKRPAGIDEKTGVREMFRAYEATPADAQLFDANMAAIVGDLSVRHHLPLTAKDLDRLAYVYQSFFLEGPGLDYSYSPASGSVAEVTMPTYSDLMAQTDANGEHHSFLATEDRYQFIKQLEAKNLVIPIVGDFGGPTALRRVGGYLAAHDATVTAFYLSNVERYLFDRRRTWKNFYANVATLPYDSKSLFIRAILNRPASTRVTLVAPIANMIRAVDDGRVRQYEDVFSIANY
jgi:hypothetical protein